MATPVALKAESRKTLGSRGNRRLRESGIIPAVVYGHHQDVIPVQLGGKELSHHLNHGVHVFNLDLEGKTESVLVKDVQFDTFGNEVIHVDFARVDLTERVEVSVSIELKGDPIGEKDGGVLQQILNELDIEVVVTEIPDVITVDVSGLAKDQSIHVSDLKLAPGITVLTDAEQLVCKVEEVQEAAPAEEGEAAAEPEVIGKAEGEEAAAAEAEAKK